MIEGHFPIFSSTSTTLGHPSWSWCTETEDDPATNWWYFTYDGNTTAYSSDAARRIKLTVDTPWPSERFVNFASLIFALDLWKKNDYATQSRQHAEKTRSSLYSRLNFHHYDRHCPTLAEYVKTTFPGYVRSWKLVEDPACANVDQCSSVDVATGLGCARGSGTTCFETMQITDDQVINKDHPLYWRLNNTTHDIAGAMRVMIQFTGGPYMGKYGFLWVGYGGAGSGG
jgi:hypothetical protein